MNVYKCDGCGAEVESLRKGMYKLVPPGWYIGGDGAISKRSIETHACSAECLKAADAARCPEARRSYMEWKQIFRRADKASGEAPLSKMWMKTDELLALEVARPCTLCVALGEACAAHITADEVLDE